MMLIDKLKNKEYYLSKLTMFLRNSYGLEEQVEVLWKVLSDVDATIDDVFNALSMTVTDDVDDLFDKLAELIGTKRQMDVTYLVNNVPEYYTLTLTNEELLRAIKTRILQNNYVGTFEEFISNYQGIGLEVLIYDTDTPSAVSIALNDSQALTDNDKKLFLAGNYTIRSVGIVYQHSILNIVQLAIWDAITSVYDSAEWGE